MRLTQERMAVVWQKAKDEFINDTSPMVVKPDLKNRDLDALLWFSDTFHQQANIVDEDCEMAQWFNTNMGQPWDYLPRQVLNDMESAYDYINGLIKYTLSQGELSMKLTDFTIKELSWDRPVFYSGESYLSWRDELPMRKPVLTRKRVNGLWWILCVADAMEKICDTLEFGELFHVLEYEKGAEMWSHGKRTLAGIARYHESKFPTAARQ